MGTPSGSVGGSLQRRILDQFHDGRQALGEGPMVLLQSGESWAGPITADDGDGESVIVNVTFAN